jgi:hypothetical protein
MKKLTVIFLLVALATVGAFAVTPGFFTFDIGAMGVYAVDGADDVDVANPFGIQFQFDDNISAGYTFVGATVNVLNISVAPAENVELSIYTGQVSGELGFGAGVGYDFLAKKDALFTSMGVYMMWLANNINDGDIYDLADGGAVSIGLKAGFGL